MRLAASTATKRLSFKATAAGPFADLTKTIALVRAPSPALAQGERTYLDRRPLDFDLAKSQHQEYCASLARLRADVRFLPEISEHPDGVFVEDAAIALDGLAILCRPGAESRRREVEPMEEALRALGMPILRIEAPGTLDGGDVLRADRKLFVGLSTRTNAEGIRQLGQLVKSRGFEVVPVKLSGCLHLKTGATYLGGGALLANPQWVDLGPFSGYQVLPVVESEPFAANSLRVGDTVLFPAEHALTAERLRVEGFSVVTTAISELATAEAGLTCLSLLT